MQFKLFSGACFAAATAFLAAPALADPSGSISAGYDYTTTSISGHSLNSNGGDVSGNIDLPLTHNWTVQADGAYQGNSGSISGVTLSDHVDDGELSAFYSAHLGRIGALVGTGQYTEKLSGFGGSVSDSLNATYYGAFGDWYAGDRVTVSARFGGVSANQGLGTSEFAGGRVVGYLDHDFALNATVDYISFHGSDLTITNAGLGAEWLVSRKTPFAVTAAWTNSQIKESGGGESITSNIFSIGGKFYFGAGSSLRDRQRSGAETWGASSPLRDFFLF